MDREYVLDRLNKKKMLDPDYLSFGVESHKYKLFSPASESKIDSLEKRFNISLPADYRNFLITISDGGAGPGYGLYSIEGALCGKKDSIYPYSEDPVGEEITKDFVRPDEVNDTKNEYLRDTGMLILCQHGCANDDFLIVNGKERGFVWEFIEWVGHYVPLLKSMPDILYVNKLPESERAIEEKKWVQKLLDAKNEEKMRFSDWYLDWLEKDPYIDPRKKRKRWFK